MSTNLFIEIAQFIGAIASLIIIHEAGHFLACRLCKVEVEEFGIGLPPYALTLFKAGGTKFTLNWLLLGGFVRPKGENDPSIKGGLAAAKPGVRLAVYLAGPVSNLLVGVILYALIFNRLGVPILTQVEISEVASNSPAEQAGLLPGDLVLKVNDTEIDSTAVLHDTIYANLDQPITLHYQRGGQTTQVVLTPRSKPPEGEGAIGIVMSNPSRRPISLVAALPLGAVALYDHGLALLSLPVRLIRGQTAPEEGRLVGFKGMFDIYQEVREAEQTPTIPAGIAVLGFFAAITISLGVLNLLPIPALDGGRMLFVLPELVLRRRIPPQYENVINLISYGLLILLLIYVNLQDFINPIQLPK